MAAIAVPGELDAPTDGDRRRIRTARRKARGRHREIEAEVAETTLAAFRAEIGATVRSASTLLAPMLAIDGMTLDEEVALIQP